MTVETATSRPAGGTGQRFTLDDVRKTYKRKDAWWTVLLVDPLASRLVLPIANRTNITPNQVTIASFVVGLLAATAFSRGDHSWLVVGALLYHLSFVLDCVDGKLARLKRTGSVFGMWLDFTFDRYRVWICAAALAYGQFERTGDVLFVWLALLVTFLDMVRYLDVFQVPKVRREMTKRLRAASRDARARDRLLGRTYVVPEGLQVRYVAYDGARDAGYHPVPGTMVGDPALYDKHERAADLHREFFARFGWWAGLRDAVVRHRVRPHLFSGIEYQMFIFILGPLFDAVVPFILVSAVLLLLFEAALVYKLTLSGRDFAREMRRLAPATAAAQVTDTATAAGTPGAEHAADEPVGVGDTGPGEAGDGADGTVAR